MVKRIKCCNKSCGRLFIPCPQVPHQKYCSRKECQQARKRAWNKKKLESDPDYREARKKAQQRWKEKNPDYWRNYRAQHPEYIQRNRREQRRKRQRKRLGQEKSSVVKTDESPSANSVLSGRYRIVPIRGDTVVKTDECIVEINAVSV